MISCSAPIKQLPQKTIKTVPLIAPAIAIKKHAVEIGVHAGDETFIRIFKQENILEVWIKAGKEFRLYKTFPICSFSGGLGPKLKQGDKQSPEGFYYITKKSLKPNSNYHLAINIGFPNRYDKYQKRTGSYLMIHGKCSSTGCYAMGNTQIDEIYTLVDMALRNAQNKVAVHIFPFKLTQQNLDAYIGNRWYSFWTNLKLGYDIFERYHVVPIVKASKDRYRFFMKKTEG
jgi:murein L,D-transpeptidase YafK